MVKKFSIDRIPKCKSDCCGKQDQHYNMKIIFLRWLHENRLPIRFVEFDRMAITSHEDRLSYQPDITIIEDGVSAWVEIETDPFNVFFKLAKISCINIPDCLTWPHTIYFAIPPLPARKNYLNVFNKMKKCVDVKNIYIYEISDDCCTPLMED